jgi:hypothetical protein
MHLSKLGVRTEYKYFGIHHTEYPSGQVFQGLDITIVRASKKLNLRYKSVRSKENHGSEDVVPC